MEEEEDVKNGQIDFLFWITVFNVLPLIQMHYQLFHIGIGTVSLEKNWHRNAIDMAMAMKMKITLLVGRKMLMDFEQIKSTDAIASQHHNRWWYMCACAI